ncbi:MAG: ester cyclase [Acidimicrobiales bacterium]
MTPADQVRRFYDEIWNVPDLAAIPTVLHADITFRGSLGSVRHGHRDFADYVRSVTTALSGYKCEIEQLVAEGDSVAARMLFSGRHTGELLGRAPTGKTVKWAGAAFFTFERELVRDLWVLGDLVSFYAQLDAGSAAPRH